MELLRCLPEVWMLNHNVATAKLIRRMVNEDVDSSYCVIKHKALSSTLGEIEIDAS
jgi:heptaprenylglyceryl phosphate synthase